MKKSALKGLTIATNADGDEPVVLKLAENGAYFIEVGDDVRVFAIRNSEKAFENFGDQIRWACIRAGKIPG